MKIGASKVTEAVVFDIFPIPRFLCVANVSWSLLPYEADLLAMTKAGYLTEVEVKISLQDLKADADKAKWRFGLQAGKVAHFYYAMPESLWDKPAAKQAIRPGAGVIVVSGCRSALRATVVVEAARMQSKPLSLGQQFNLARVGSFRAWSPQQRHRARQLKAERELEAKRRDLEWKKTLASYKAA